MTKFGKQGPIAHPGTRQCSRCVDGSSFQADLCEFESSLINIMSSRAARAMQTDPVSRKKRARFYLFFHVNLELPHFVYCRAILPHCLFGTLLFSCICGHDFLTLHSVFVPYLQCSCFFCLCTVCPYNFCLFGFGIRSAQPSLASNSGSSCISYLSSFLVYSLYHHAWLYFNVQCYFNVQTAVVEFETRKCDFSSFFLLQTVVLVTFPVAMTHYLTKNLQKGRVPSAWVHGGDIMVART